MLTRAAVDGMLADTIATGAEFDPADTFFSVFSAVVDHQWDTVVADLTEDLVNYPRVAITTWGTPYHAANGVAVVDSPVIVTPGAGAPNAIRIIGVALTDASTAGVLKRFFLLPAPITIEAVTDVFSAVVRLSIDPSGNLDLDVTWDG